MPCGYFQHDINELSIQENKSLRHEVARLTQLLCWACRALESINVNLPGELGEWWRLHQAEDKRREAALQEQARQKSLADIRDRLMSQLTDIEKEALGIKE